MKILFLTNGYGEDTIAFYIIKQLKNYGFNDIAVFPLVTEGDVFSKNGISLCGPIKLFPSRGISGVLNLGNFFKDISNGLLNHLFKQLDFLKKLTDCYFVVVGDIYPLLLLYFSKKIHRSIFVATAKSVRTEFFNFVEISLMKKTIANFVRDEDTKEWILKNYKINNVYWVGNPVLDIPYPDKVDDSFNTLFESLDRNIIFLPGRKDWALQNVKLFRDSFRILIDKGFSFSIVVPSYYPVSEIESVLQNIRNVFVIDSVYYRFLLERSFLVWGFGGSANEQAAGFGLPIISFYQNNWYRMRQKKLLGEALILVKDIKSFIDQTIFLSENKDYYNYLSNYARRMMGDFGGAKNIAEFIKNNVII